MSESASLIVGSATQASFDLALAFRAQAAVVNNLSNQWVELLDANDTFVPPYIVNMIVPVGGSTRFRASFAAPTGIAQAATIAGQRVTVEVYETALQPSAGQLFPVRAPSTEWRNPKGLVFSSGFNSQVGGAANVADWTYTVPAGRRARIDTAQVMNELSVSDGTGAGTAVEAQVAFFPLGASGTVIVEAPIVNGTVVGARADAMVASGKELMATDIVQGIRKNPRGAGVTAIMFEIAVITEGDA